MSEDKNFYEESDRETTESDVAQVDGIERGRYGADGGEVGTLEEAE